MRLDQEDTQAFNTFIKSAKFSQSTKVISANFDITAKGSIVNILDPNGGTYSVRMPPLQAGRFFVVTNTGGAGTLNVINFEGGAITTLPPGVSVLLFAGDDTWNGVTGGGTLIGVFGPVGPTHATGLVPDPGPGSPSSPHRYLAETGVWETVVGLVASNAYFFGHKGGAVTLTPVGSETLEFLSANTAISILGQSGTTPKSMLFTLNAANIDHNALLNYSADQHVAHSGVTLTAGLGISGGGTIAASRTFDFAPNELSIVSPVAGDYVVMDLAAGGPRRSLFSSLAAIIDHNALLNYVPNQHFDHTTISITASTGLVGGGTIAANRVLALDLNSLVVDTLAPGDFFPFYDVSGGDHNKASLTSLNSSLDHNALANYVPTQHVDHSTVSINTIEGVQGGGNITATRTLKLDVNGLTLKAVPTTADFIPIYDVVSSTHKKINWTAGGGGGGRTVLSANTDYYVNNTTGSDANSGAIGAPWATLQHVADYLAESIDLNNKIVTIHVADSATVYPGASLRPLIGGGDLVFLGNNAALGNVKIGNSPEVAAIFSSAGLGGTLFWICGFEFVQTNGAALDFDGTDRGTCSLGEPTFLIASCNKFSSCQNGSYVLIGNIFDNSLGTSVIDGTALNAHTPKGFYASFNATTYGAYLNLPNFSLTGTVTFSRGFACPFAGFVTFSGSTIGSGVVHGHKFEIGAAGTIFIDSITQLPGDVPGINYGGTISINASDACWVGPWPTAKSLQVPTTGFSILIADTVGALILKPAGSLLAGSIMLPGNPIDQQRLTISSTTTITTLTISPNTGQSVMNAPVTFVAGSAISAIYNASDTTWYMSVGSGGGGGGGGMAIGAAVGGGTNKSVLFIDASVNLAQDNANFWWDDAANNLHIGGAYHINADRAVYVVPNGTGDNWFEGNAGNLTVTGYQNFGTGTFALSSLTSGYQNTAVGANALRLATTAHGNMAMGTSALFSLTSGFNNFAIGVAAAQQITTNDGNFAVGNNSLSALTSGDGNTALGTNVLQSLSTGSGNVAIGLSSAIALVSGDSNALIGSNAGRSVSSGNFNTMIGSYAGFLASAATGSIHVGMYSGLNITTSNRNTLIGSWTGPSAGVSDVIAFSLGFNGSGGNLMMDYNYTLSGFWTAAANFQLASGFGYGAISKAGAPAASDLPAGTYGVIDDTTNNQTWLCFNKAGTIRKVQLV